MNKQNCKTYLFLFVSILLHVDEETPLFWANWLIIVGDEIFPHPFKPLILLQVKANA